MWDLEFQVEVQNLALASDILSGSVWHLFSSYSFDDGAQGRALQTADPYLWLMLWVPFWNYRLVDFSKTRLRTLSTSQAPPCLEKSYFTPASKDFSSSCFLHLKDLCLIPQPSPSISQMAMKTQQHVGLPGTCALAACPALCSTRIQINSPPWCVMRKHM